MKDSKRNGANHCSGDRIERNKSNIHLVRYDAISLFTERDSAGDWIRSIEINPSLLLYEEKRHAISDKDFPLSLKIMRDKVSLLLAAPLHVPFIVPGLVCDDEAVSYWSEIDAEVYFPGISISCLHNLSHPLTGLAQGAKVDRIQLGDKKDNCVIRIKVAQWEINGPNGLQIVEGIRVRLILRGRILTEEFKKLATTTKIDNTWRLTSFSLKDAARVHQSVLARMEGNYLPVPVEWRNSKKGDKALSPAKTIALLSRLTNIHLDDIRKLYEEISCPAESTIKRMDERLPLELSRLAPVPVGTLFQPSAYSFQNPGGAQVPSELDSLIDAAYG